MKDEDRTAIAQVLGLLYGLGIATDIGAGRYTRETASEAVESLRGAFDALGPLTSALGNQTADVILSVIEGRQTEI